MVSINQRIAVRLKDSGGWYVTTGRVKQIVPTGILFTGFDRGGFPIEIGVALDAIVEERV